MYTLVNLPVEITKEIFSHLLRQHRNVTFTFKNNKSKLLLPGEVTTTYCPYQSPLCKKANNNVCLCWQLDLFSVAMVCKSWYSLAIEFMLYHNQQKYEMPWLPLLNYASPSRDFPFRARLVKLIRESMLSNLVFHHSIRHLAIDFASFDTILREKSKNSNVLIKKRVHNTMALSDMVQLLKMSTSVEILEIKCDASFISLLNSNENSITDTLDILMHNGIDYSNIKRLDLVGVNPVQRCPCCASRDWDKYLRPFIPCLTLLGTLVLQNVLPSALLFKTFANQKNIKKIVLYRSLITIPSDNSKKGEKRENSIGRIPLRLWNQITSFEIYEDLDDASTWSSRRYLYDFIDIVGPQLQEFKLQFGSRQENEASLAKLHNDTTDNQDLPFIDSSSILHQLKLKCTSLNLVSLVNVPDFQPIRIV